MCHYRGASIKCVDVTKHHNWSPVLTVSGPIREPRPITGTVRLLRRWQLCYKSQVTCCWPLLSRWSVCGQPRVVLCISVYVVVSTRHYALHSTEAAGRYTSPHTALCRTPDTANTTPAPEPCPLLQQVWACWQSSTRKHRLTIRYYRCYIPSPFKCRVCNSSPLNRCSFLSIFALR